MSKQYIESQFNRLKPVMPYLPNIVISDNNGNHTNHINIGLDTLEAIKQLLIEDQIKKG